MNVFNNTLFTVQLQHSAKIRICKCSVNNWKCSGCSADPVRTGRTSPASVISHRYTQHAHFMLDQMHSFISQILQGNLKNQSVCCRTPVSSLLSQWRAVWPVPVQPCLHHYLPVWCPFSLSIGLIADMESFVGQHVWQKVGSKYIFITTAWAFVISGTLNIYWPMLYGRNSTISLTLCQKN